MAARRMVLIGGALGWILSGGSPAPALEWNGPESCTAETFEASLEDYLREAEPETQVVRVTVTVRDGVVWTVEVVMVDETRAESRRELEGAGCREVSEAAALVVALAVDPAVDHGAIPLPPPASEAETAPVEHLPAKPPAVPAVEAPVALESPPSAGFHPRSGDPTTLVGASNPAPQDRRARAVLRAHGGVAGLALPSGGALFGAALGVRIGRGWLDAVGSYRLPTLTEAPELPGVGGRLSRWAVGVRGCFAPTANRVAFPLCLGLEGGQVIARGQGLRPNRTKRLPWVAPTAAAGVVWSPVRRVGLGAELGVGVPLLRHTYTIDGLGPVYEIGPVALSGLAVIEVTL